MADMWDQFPDAKAVTGKRAADMWDQFQDAAPQAPQAPKQQGWMEWASELVTGKQDPKEQGTATVFEQYPQELGNPTASAANLGASDAQMGDIISQSLGDRVMRRERDVNGYEVIVTRGPDGQEKRGYVNAPGLDMQDVTRGIRGALPYTLGGAAGAVAGAGRGVAANAVLQGVAAGDISAGGDLALESMGSKQGIEPGKALTAAIGGAAGPVLSKAGSALWQRFVVEPRFFDRATGTLTQDGMAAAQQMGLDPATLTKDAIKRFAQEFSVNPQQATKMVDAGTLEFNIPQTLGQRTKDAEQLMTEKAMRVGGYGPQAKDIIGGIDEAQTKAVAEAARGTIPKRFLSSADPARPIPSKIAAAIQNLPEVPLQTDQMGASLQSAAKVAQKAAKDAERQAWDATEPVFVDRAQAMAPDPMTPMTGTGKAVTTTPSRGLLETSIRYNLGDLADVFDEVNTPTAYRMGQRLLSFIEGRSPNNALKQAFDLPSNASVDTMRKSIGAMVKDAQTPTDKAAASAIYKAYNEWMKEAADQGLLSGDLGAVAKFRSAIDVSREINKVFRPMAKGRPTDGGKIIDKVMTADTPEHVVTALFSSPQAGIKPGALEAIKLMRQAVSRYGDDAAVIDMWSGVKVAHWSTLVQNKKGELFSPQVMLNNIKMAMENQASLVGELYTPVERETIMRFAKQLEGITWKDPNPSGTATGLMALTRGVFGRLMGKLPDSIRAAVELSGVPRAYGTTIARKAAAQAPVRSSTAQGPNLAPLTAVVGQGVGRDRDRKR